MKLPLSRCVFAALLVSWIGAATPFAHAQVAEAPAGSSDAVASVDDLKTEAFKALRGGKFDRTNELLALAAARSDDPALDRMANWAQQFEAQRQQFTTERRKQYDEAVADVKKLLDAGYDSYAIDSAKAAFVLAEDKKAFRTEPWVDSLINRTMEMVAEAEKEQDWLKVFRLYSDLGAVEPGNALWKERLKLATRRVRLLNLFTPEQFKQMVEAEAKVREQALAIIRPTTQPTTRNADADLDNDTFRIDWRETLKGVEMDMLQESLTHAKSQYYRDVSYKDLTLGGLRALKALTTTRGLETAFAGLADAEKRDGFLKTIEECFQAAAAANAVTEQSVMRSVLAKLKLANAQTVQLPREVLVSEFADGAFGELDQFSSIVWPFDMEEFNKNTQGEFTGVGISIQIDDDNNLKVVSPLPDTPAIRAGIRAGDIITHINGKKSRGITTNQAVKAITGPAGTEVTLTIQSPDGNIKDYAIRREIIKVESVKGYEHSPDGRWDYFIDPDQKIGYIRMSNFTRTTTEELSRALKAIRNAGGRGMILDLRYNPGGLLSAATEVSDRFLSGGVIVSTRADRDTPNQPSVIPAQKGDDEENDLPLIVLVNQLSASASEIVSGALKDQKRALVVGDRTFGKGSVQMLFPLSNRSAYLKLTTSHYYLPSGRCIHREENSTEWGVDPDVMVEMTPDQMRTAINVRQEMDVLRSINAAGAEDELRQLQDVAPVVENEVKQVEKEKKHDIIGSDPQLAAALLLLRLQLNGAQI